MKKDGNTTIKNWLYSMMAALVAIIVISVYRGVTISYRMEGIVAPLADGMLISGMLFIFVGVIIMMFDFMGFYPVEYFMYVSSYNKKENNEEEKLGFYAFSNDLKGAHKRREYLPLYWTIIVVGVVSVALAFLITELFYVV
ncbi:MAG: hypothetical protein K6F37_08250 [Lachnospiraceae bacterium]|nr:hypothetical protein [Lachnospiraceae bacterium]